MTEPPHIIIPRGVLDPPILGKLLGGIPIIGITLADEVPFEYWVKSLAVMDEEATLAMQGRYRVGGGQEKYEITYPELNGVSGVNWVYVAWKGLIRMRHRATGVERLTAEDVQEMGAAAVKMKPGQRYQWVRGCPQLLIRPFPGPPFSPCYGTIRFHADPDPPLWNLMRPAL